MTVTHVYLLSDALKQRIKATKEKEDAQAIPKKEYNTTTPEENGCALYNYFREKDSWKKRSKSGYHDALFFMSICTLNSSYNITMSYV